MNAALAASQVQPDDASQGMPFLTKSISAWILKRCRKGNARIAREYLGLESGELFHVDPNRPYSHPRTMKDDPFLKEIIYFFTSAITNEHVARLKAETELRDLKRRMEILENRLQIDKA